MKNFTNFESKEFFGQSNVVIGYHNIGEKKNTKSLDYNTGKKHSGQGKQIPIFSVWSSEVKLLPLL